MLKEVTNLVSAWWLLPASIERSAADGLPPLLTNSLWEESVMYLMESKYSLKLITSRWGCRKMPTSMWLFLLDPILLTSSPLLNICATKNLDIGILKSSALPPVLWAWCARSTLISSQSKSFPLYLTIWTSILWVSNWELSSVLEKFYLVLRACLTAISCLGKWKIQCS